MNREKKIINKIETIKKIFFLLMNKFFSNIVKFILPYLYKVNYFYKNSILFSSYHHKQYLSTYVTKGTGRNISLYFKKIFFFQKFLEKILFFAKFSNFLFLFTNKLNSNIAGS